MTLVEFLLARLDEDERAAREATSWCHGGEWTADLRGGIQVRRAGAISLDQPPVVARHIVRHSPGRVLREVEAKRRVIADHALWMGWFDDRPTCRRCYDGDDVYDKASEYPCLTLRALALLYADHEDYDEAWRP